jgi:tRNA-dihydrouridine synthase A
MTLSLSASSPRIIRTLPAHWRPVRARHLGGGTPLRAIARQMLGLYQGRPGARSWRRTLSDAARLSRNDVTLLLHALEQVELMDPAEA